MIKYRIINHSNYSLQEREALLLDFRQTDSDVPHVLLSTCNRIEDYRIENYGAEDFSAGNSRADDVVPEHVVRHLYRVAAGLESALIGERAIQGQLKQAYFEACEHYRLPSSLNRLFQTAIHTGKRVRTETRISEGAVSHSQITVEILKQHDIDLKNSIISIIGVNKLTEDILRFLSDRGACNIFLSNRHFEKAQALATQYQSTAMRLEQKRRLLEFTDVLISATSAPHLIVHREDMPVGRRMLIFDLAFPRDVSEEIAILPDVKLYNLEDIESFARNSISLRQAEITRAEEIISEEIIKFRQWESYRLKASN
ncbi:MAG: glutamyl-tRNA reductase [Tannerella sp.]|jgi:glutamyl-tRNA reductase|nr:glutamyl-tRNA reductase [Tannerella sp.]